MVIGSIVSGPVVRYSIMAGRHGETELSHGSQEAERQTGKVWEKKPFRGTSQ
jgi:hypothetical protein